MKIISKKPSDVKSNRIESADTEPTKVEEGMIVQVVSTGKYYEYVGDDWVEIEPREALIKWEKRQSSCVKDKP